MLRHNKIALAVGVVMLLAVALAAFLPFGMLRTSEQDEVALHQAVEIGDTREQLGLMTSLPIYWQPAGSMQEMLAPTDGEDARHWVRESIEETYELVPLDALSNRDGGVARELAALDRLLLAQPYTLTPGDNVALDEWLRDGGRLLMFADPMLTEHSEFGIGDRRRPQDVGLVPPVFARWGLEQSVDDAKGGAGPALVEWETAGIPIPTNRRGVFSLTVGTSEATGQCNIVADGLIADCTIGQGRALIVADAALLERVHSDHGHDEAEHQEPREQRETLLKIMLDRSVL